MTKNRSLVNETIQQLENYIQQNELTIGDKLPVEKELAEIFGVGRSTLREAVKILVFSNVLEVKQGSGTFVKNGSIGEFSTGDLLRARSMIEGQAVLLATVHQSEKDLLRLKEVLFQRNHLLEAGKFSEYIEADLAFHQQIVAMSQNPFLIKWYNELLPDIKLHLSQQVLRMEDYQDNTSLHNKIYRALLEGKAEETQGMIQENIFTDEEAEIE
ncbi:GntR family transcriptional regulator [Enterococcus hulanensis]|uniref:GntR family transcriptional regulator n=1 Tax=Enterococcus hulanensis TaxID=2559929 RepID=A0ABU3F0L1_9ENTE|nr:GntR family transcriptional regulator [Enterococcus hulanensis]MDT2600673.1 GntR family transcriptional regulator [Enterococcus hulanensis]MDT2610196.1 GntR family transcriptional regulator [Enterococcus hulanensis]MDT2617396.1 GntR family transcriptional regulator [Enterococcus hulanensis]MDT2628141.1 GntR family transcriptional regulator [Enterococcus hulanensis]MDT2655246.1 GntR family transcriptional regulator [Enterococcus hulanensis]